MTKAIELSQLGNVLTVAEGTGNVGIRESSPSYEFHVKGAGTVAYFEGTGGNSFIGLEDSDDSTIGFIGVDGGSLKFQTSGNSYSDKLVITAAGQVGIGGIASTGALLHLRDSNNATKGAAQLKINKGVGTAAPTSISRADCYIHLGGSEWGNGGTGIYLMGLGYTNGETGTGIPAYVGFKETSSSGYTKGDLIFGTRANTTGTSNATERLRIASDNTTHVGERDGNQNSTIFGKGIFNIVGPDPINTSFTAAGVYLQVGGTESELNGLYPIGFGFRSSASTHVPAYIAYKTISSSGAEKGELLFATRDVTTDTQPSVRMTIGVGGTITIGDSTYGGDLGQLRIINDASSAPASLALFGHNNTSGGDPFGQIQFAEQEGGTGGQIKAKIEAQAVSTNERGSDLVFFTAANTASSSPTEKLRITSDGKVLINDASLGNSRTDAPLQIETGGSGNALNLRARSSDDIYSYINFQNNAATQVAAEIYMVRSATTNAGNLVFGTANPNSSTPQQRMMISSGGATTLHVNSASHETFRFTTQAVNEAKLMMKDAGNNVDIQLNTGGDSWFNGGKVGIGENAPDNLLHLKSTDSPAIELEQDDGTSYKGLIKLAGNDLEIRGSNGQLEFYTGNVDGDSSYLRGAITSAGHKWTHNGSIFHGSNDVTDFTDAGRATYNNVSIRAGNPSVGTTPTNDKTAIKIYPAGSRDATVGNLTGGIAWQHLDPNNGAWGTTYGAGAQIWMGAALHDTPGQERDRFNLWMNSQTSGNAQPNNLAIEAYPNGVVRHPKLPCFMVRNSTSGNAFFANAKATWNTIDLNNGSHFDNANDRFICPIDGFYHFSCQMLSMNDQRLFHELRKNGSRVDGTRTESYDPSTNSYQTNTFVAVVQASANDYFEVWLGSQNGYGSVYANFNGHLIG